MFQHRKQAAVRACAESTRNRVRKTAATTGLLLLCVCFAQWAEAASITLAWDPVQDAQVAVYQVHYGSASGQYDKLVESASSSAAVPNLQPGVTYYFAVRACDAARLNCSAFSNEVSTSIASAAAPVADFSANVTLGEAPLTVLFSDKSSGQITSRKWRFGDGATEAGAAVVTHTYTAPGSYTVRLDVTGPGGSDSQVSNGYISVLAANTAANGGQTPITSTDGGSGGNFGTPIVEAGELTINHKWQRVTFQRAFIDPVVVVRPLSANGNQAATARVDGVDAKGFWVRVQEWDYLDGGHAAEQAGYVVIERGRHQLPGGAWVEAGLVQTGGAMGFGAVPFGQPFDTVPVVLTGVTTFNEADAVTTRLRNINKTGFQLRLQEQQANAQQHASETVAYIAWEPSSGVLDGYRFEAALAPGAIKHTAARLDFQTPFAAPPALLADMQTTNGADVANLRWRDKRADSVELWVAEETSADAETGHVAEQVGYLLIAGEDDALPIEAGEVDINHEWTRVTFGRRFADPVVVAKPLSANGGQPATVRIQDVDTEGFWLRVQEWDYLDGSHTRETAGYLVVERGRHQLPDGAWVEAGLLDSGGSMDFLDVTLEAPFADAPVVLSGVASNAGPSAVVTRVADVDGLGFRVRLQEQEANAPQHAPETIAYVAWEPSAGVVNGRRFEVGHTAGPVNHAFHEIGYLGTFAAAPVFLADMQTAYGDDTANLRWRNKDADSVQVRVVEEGSWDNETGHPAEDVGYLVIE